MNFSEKMWEQNGAACLPEGTVLHETYQILETLHADSCGISYLAKEKETETRYCVRECFPHLLAERKELTVTWEDSEAFEKAKQRFFDIKELLSARKPPHLAEVLDFFEENGTMYCVTAYHELTSLAETALPMTPAYVRSLGIGLCDTYIALKGLLCCGVLTKESLCFDAQGGLFLSMDRIFEVNANQNADSFSDVHALTAFLTDRMRECEEKPEQSESPSMPVLQEVLRHSYQDPALLKAALICEEGAVKQPKPVRPGRRPVLFAAACIIFLSLGIFAAGQVYRSKASLRSAVSFGTIKPDVITVWAPLEEGTDEEAAIAAYDRLTMGFEEKYPGYGVTITLFAGESFEEALQFHSAAPPVVFMDSQDEAVVDMAADLSLLTRSLHDTYLADMEGFGTGVPLGCSLPALYWNIHSGEEIAGETIAYEEIPPTIVYDQSVSDFILQMDDGRKASEFGIFLENGSQPILAGTDRMTAVRRDAAASGAVQMLPVSVNGSYPLQYEMYCSINRDADINSQRIGMLWLQYLLTEEAQEVLFSYRSGMFPIHRGAFSEVTAQHSEFEVFETLMQDFDSTMLQ